jgi:uncharacterized membrane protein YfcA
MSASNLLLPIYGFIVGLLVGLTGMGGGVIMTPVLMLGLGLPASTAVGTDLAYATLTKIVGTWQHWRQGTVDIAVVRGLALGSVPASLVAVLLLTWLRRGDHDRVDGWLEHAIGAALLVAALLMLYRLVRGRGRAATVTAAAHARAKLIAIGALGGLMVGLTSIGSGSLILALLVLVVPLGAERLVGTDVAHATLLVGTAAIAHLFAGDVDLGMVGWLVIGSIPGILVGSRLVLRVPRRPLQIGLAGLLLTTSVPLLR